MKLKPILSRDPKVASPVSKMMEPHKAFEEGKKHKDLIATRYDEAINFAYPGRMGIYSGPDSYEIYDDTAVVSAQEFASRVQAGVTPNYARWASHIAGVFIEEPEQKKQMQEQLQGVDEFIFEMINMSNFPLEINEAYQDLAVGTMCMVVEEQSGLTPLHCEAMPLNELYFTIGPDGRPDNICRLRKLTAAGIRTVYPEASGIDEIERTDPLCKHDVVEICQRNWDKPTQHEYRYSLFLPNKNNMIISQYVESGPGACKFLVTRWSKSSGEAWGRGPLLNCLPSMRIVNFAMKSLIDHAEMALAGIWSAEDDGVLNTETVVLEPGTLIPRAPGSQPLQNVASGGNFDIQNFLVEEHRNNIKKALFTEQLGNPNKTPMTATEVDQRMAELSRAIGAPFGRIVYEFVMPFIARVRRILVEKKMIMMPQVDGRELKATVTSPLARTQDMEDIDRTVKYISTVTQMFGPEAAALTVDTTEASLYLGEKFGVPQRLNRSREEQRQLSEQIAQAQGAMNAEQGGPAEPPAE